MKKTVIGRYDSLTYRMEWFSLRAVHSRERHVRMFKQSLIGIQDEQHSSRNVKKKIDDRNINCDSADHEFCRHCSAKWQSCTCAYIPRISQRTGKSSMKVNLLVVTRKGRSSQSVPEQWSRNRSSFPPRIMSRSLRGRCMRKPLESKSRR